MQINHLHNYERPYYCSGWALYKSRFVRSFSTENLEASKSLQFHIWVGRANGKRNATRNEIGNAKLNFYCQPQLLRLSVANNYTIVVDLRGEEAEIISVKWSWKKNWKESARDSLEEVGRVKEKFIFKNRFSTLSTGREILLGEIQFAGQDLW